MNILKTGKRKILAGIMAAIMLLAIVPVATLTAIAADTTIEDRLALAEEKGISEWVDTDGYLKESYYQNKLSHYEMEQLGVQPLIRNYGEAERTARIRQLQSGIMTRTVTAFRDMVTDGVSIVGYFEVDGHVAVCIEHSVATPGLNSPTGPPVESFNETLRKVLYYGSYGPGDILGTSDAAWVKTSLAASRANGDTAGTDASFINQIAGLPSPPAEFKVWTVTSNGGATQDLAYWTIEAPAVGWLNLAKSSTAWDTPNGNGHYSLAGAVYGVYTEWDCINQVGTLTTDDWGNTNTIELAPGAYYVREIAAPLGYNLDPNTYEAVINSQVTTTVYSSDAPQKGWANLVKSSANADISNGNGYYSLAGAVYGVYTEWDCINQVGTLTTDEWGNTNAVELYAGTYYVKEITAPMGYYLDYNVYEVFVTNNQTATVYVSDVPHNDPIAIVLQKQDSETGTTTPQGDAKLENAEFTIKYFAGIYDTNPENQGIPPARTWVLKTNEMGALSLTDTLKVSGDDFYLNSNGTPTLPIGTITIQETKAPEGYLLNPEIFVRQIVGDGTDQFISTYNAPTIPEQVMKGSVELYKADAESGNALAGAVYGIYFHDGTEVARLTTDANGYAKSGLLPYGQYYLQEITAPTGYVLDTTQHPFTIGADGQVITINATDEPQMGQIQGTKTGEVLTGSDFRLTEHGMLYTPIYEVQGLPNAEYEIYAKEDIATPEGTVKYTAGQLIETVMTDEQGMFTSQQLYLGTYVVKEKTAPEGYVLDTTEYEVTLSYGGQNQSVILSPISLSDERQKVAISFFKEMEDHMVYPNPDAYLDVQFGLYTAEEILDVTGTTALEPDSLLEVITLTPDATGTLTGTVTLDLPIGNYYLQEIATNEAHILDETKYPVNFAYQGQEIATVKIVANAENAIVNELKKGTVELIKESNFHDDILSQGFENRRLEGAVYGIYSTDGTEIARLTTDADGYAKSDLLAYGNYYLKEITPPYGYEINEIEYPFTIGADGELITITAVDDPKIGAITATYTENGGSERMSAAATGDSTMPLYITAGVLLISGGTVALILIFRKKRRKN